MSMGKGKPGSAKMTVGASSAGFSKPGKGGKNGTQSSNVKKVAPQVIVGTVRAPGNRSRGR